jgi:mercuric ion binding protein
MLARLIGALIVAVVPSLAVAADVQSVTLDVKGMHCGTCPLTVKVILLKQPGVSEVKMDADKKAATVKFDAAKATPQALAHAVTEAGYPATPRK